MGVIKGRDSAVKPETITIEVNTKQLDEAIDKANQLVRLLERSDALLHRVDMNRTVQSKCPMDGKGTVTVRRL